MGRLTSILLLGTALAAGAWPAGAQEPMNIVFTHHSSASNPFWQAVKKGFDDACVQDPGELPDDLHTDRGFDRAAVGEDAGGAFEQARTRSLPRSSTTTPSTRSSPMRGRLASP